ncbi:unnamed protein product [Linum trigynum]|uniref:VQ domain-containing protein n=1 Tax=Linum trigynum TaxID=586398 RepID=A0AAV2E4N5_9ROSI
MEAYSSSSSSSTSSMYLAAANNNVITSSSSSDAPRKPFHSSLHTIRNSNTKKPWNNKKLPIAPLPPNPPKVYKVDPFNFRDLVQRLTGAAAAEASLQPQYQQIQHPRIQKLDLLERQPQPPPPPMQQLLLPGGLVERQEGSPFSGLFRELMMAERSSYVEEDSNNNINDYFYNNNNDITASDSSVELNLLPSPTSQHCWFPQLLSPAGPGNLISGLNL